MLWNGWFTTSVASAVPACLAVKLFVHPAMFTKEESADSNSGTESVGAEVPSRSVVVCGLQFLRCDVDEMLKILPGYSDCFPTKATELSEVRLMV